VAQMKKYHVAKIEMTMKCMANFLQYYEANEYDDNLVDPITLNSQSEYFLSGKSLWPCLPSLQCVMNTVPLMMRTVTVALPHSEGIKMNPWQVIVVALPGVIKMISTKDFFHMRNKVINGERINSGFLITNHPEKSLLSTGAGKQISSALLLSSFSGYHPESDLAMWGSVVIFILKRENVVEWMKEELKTIEFLNKSVYHCSGASWKKYLNCVQSDSFRLCLLAQHPSQPACLRCPHLNKFILACFVLREKLSVEELKLRRNALISEYYFRIAKPNNLNQYFDANFQAITTKVLDSIEFELLPSFRETVQNFTHKLSKYDFSKIDFKLKLPDYHKSNKTFGCQQILQIFFNMNNELIPELKSNEWESLFVHGVSNTDAMKRSSNIQDSYNQSRFYVNLRSVFVCSCVSYTLDQVPFYCLKKYWKYRSLSDCEFDIMYDSDAKLCYQLYWLPAVNQYFIDKILADADPISNG
jgi:hypothetical protein